MQVSATKDKGLGEVKECTVTEKKPLKEKKRCYSLEASSQLKSLVAFYETQVLLSVSLPLMQTFFWLITQSSSKNMA